MTRRMAFSQDGGFVFLTETGCPDIYVGDFCWPSTRMSVDLLNSSLFILLNPSSSTTCCFNFAFE